MENQNLTLKLKKSFTSVKQDVDNVKDIQDKQNAYIADNLRQIEAIKNKQVSLEKFEYLKKQLAELSESTKKLWEMDDELKSVEDRTISKSFFNQQFEQLTDEFDDIKNGLSLLNKETISKFQINELIADLNDEFSKVKTTIEEIRNIKDSITHKELEKKANGLNHKIEDSSKHITILEEKIANRPTRSQIETNYNELRKDLSKVRSDFETTRRALSDKLDNSYTGKIQNELVNIKSTVKQKADTKEVEHIVDGVNREFKKMDNYIRGVNDVLTHVVPKKDFTRSITKVKEDIQALRKDAQESIKTSVSKKYVDNGQTILKDSIKKVHDAIESVTQDKANAIDIEKRLKTIVLDLNSIKKESQDLSKVAATKKYVDDRQEILREQVKVLDETLKSIKKEKLSKAYLEKQHFSVQKQITQIDSAYKALSKTVTGDYTLQKDFENRSKEIRFKVEKLSKDTKIVSESLHKDYMTKADFDKKSTQTKTKVEDLEKGIKLVVGSLQKDYITKKGFEKDQKSFEKQFTEILKRVSALEKDAAQKIVINDKFTRVNKDIKTIKEEQKDIKHNYVKKTIFRTLKQYLNRLYKKVELPIENSTFKELDQVMPKGKNKD